jgi:1-acyl-sn-glycerol-3-phosphate acyltransferase
MVGRAQSLVSRNQGSVFRHMNRLPLSHELPYRFQAPRLNRYCLWLGRLNGRSMLRRDHRIEAFDFAGLEHLTSLLARGDGILLAPNHTDHADSHLMFELSRRVGRRFYYMAAYQIFQGRRGWYMSRIGAFPVDREGADLTAFKTAVEILSRATNPLVIFPEGEMYHLNDQLTPLRDGAAAVAATAAKRLGESGKTVWIVPVAIKYRYLEHVDPTPALQDVMDELERRVTWWPQRCRPLVERIYFFAEGMLNLKEFEYLGEPQRGPLPERLKNLREFILGRVEAKRVKEPRRRDADQTVPERIKDLRRACVDALSDAATTPEQAADLNRDLHDIFVACQTFSYPGDYVRDCPTLERVAETLMKFEEDLLGIREVKPHGPRRAVLRVGEPIDVRARFAAAGKPRAAIPALTSELETTIQTVLDAIGPGRPLEPEAAVPQPSVSAAEAKTA